MFITGSITDAMGFTGKPLIFGRNPRLADESRRKAPILYAAIFYYILIICLPTLATFVYTNDP